MHIDVFNKIEPGVMVEIAGHTKQKGKVGYIIKKDFSTALVSINNEVIRVHFKNLKLIEETKR